MTVNCVYYWECEKNNYVNYPSCKYIEMTKGSSKPRLSEHRDYTKRDVVTEPSREHFTQAGHTVAHLRGQVLEKVKSNDPFIFKARE